jgi:hypothetical protein
MPELTDQQPSPRQRNWAPWIAVLLALAAILSNAGFFVALPGQRALAWLGVVLAIAAIVCAVIGVMRAFRQPQIYGGKVSSAILGIVSLLICGLVAVTSIGSRAMPAATNAPQVGQKVPDFTLADTTGNKVSLNQLLGKADLPVSASASNTAAQTTPGGLSPTTAIYTNTATPTKAVLLVFYRGYW